MTEKASATRPKSAGVNNRARTRVDSTDNSRLPIRNANTQPKLAAIRPDKDDAVPGTGLLSEVIARASQPAMPGVTQPKPAPGRRYALPAPKVTGHLKLSPSGNSDNLTGRREPEQYRQRFIV
jgi:hypothetical protein